MVDATRAPAAAGRGEGRAGFERLLAGARRWFARSGLAAAPVAAEAQDLLYRAEVGR